MANEVGVTELGAEDLRASFRGELILPGDGEYAAAHSAYNRMIDRRPGSSSGARMWQM
jgi:hypothetical protein